MNYVTAATVNLSYVIPAAKAANSVALQYHCEVLNVHTGVRKNVAAGTVVAAVLGVSDGSVAFTLLPTPTDGPYIFSVFYADNADLDTASITKVGVARVQKITAVTAVTA